MADVAQIVLEAAKQHPHMQLESGELTELPPSALEQRQRKHEITDVWGEQCFVLVYND